MKHFLFIVAGTIFLSANLYSQGVVQPPPSPVTPPPAQMQGQIVPAQNQVAPPPTPVQSQVAPSLTPVQNQVAPPPMPAQGQAPVYNGNHEGRNDIFEFIDENGTCQQAQLVTVPSQDPNETLVEWQTKLPSDMDWQSPSRWLHYKGTNGISYEMRVEVNVVNNSGDDDSYHFNCIAVPMSGDGEQKEHAKLGFQECNGTIWWCKKMRIDHNGKIYFDLGNRRPE